MLSKTILSSSLHTGLLNLRSLSRYGFRSFTTTATAPEPKIIYEQLSPQVSEIKLNAPKNLNSLDFEMVHTLIKRLKLW